MSECKHKVGQYGCTIKSEGTYVDCPKGYGIKPGVTCPLQFIPISKVKELIEKKSFIASWQMDVDHAKTIAFTGYGGIIKIEDLKNLIKGAEGG